MKVIQILKHQGWEFYTLGLKLIFIYAEYSEPSLFASLINFCMAKFPELLRVYRGTLQLAGKNGLILFKIINVSEIIVRGQNKPVHGRA
ncbi:hypothetical protein SAMN05216524_103485 [Mucilaginibacter sp. OK098]|nr:hypothetical protein SAMN05216524_103485 [Mucilaginibacter sp. OK098]